VLILLGIFFFVIGLDAARLANLASIVDAVVVEAIAEVCID
jgi:hypothetical protein